MRRRQLSIIWKHQLFCVLYLPTACDHLREAEIYLNIAAHYWFADRASCAGIGCSLLNMSLPLGQFRVRNTVTKQKNICSLLSFFVSAMERWNNRWSKKSSIKHHLSIFLGFHLIQKLLSFIGNNVSFLCFLWVSVKNKKTFCSIEYSSCRLFGTFSRKKEHKRQACLQIRSNYWSSEARGKATAMLKWLQ